MNKLTRPSTDMIKDSEWTEAEKKYAPNCGPTALSVMANVSILRACEAIPDFAQRHYTNPTMMAAALRALKIDHRERDDAQCEGHTLTRYGLVRIQWEGPWTAAGADPRWAYRQTHWIGSAIFNWPDDSQVHFVFDVNCGWQTVVDWEHIHVPKIIQAVVDKRATGRWWATHRWELS